MKKGLVLEGGGVRGIYTAGVLDVFLENSVTFDGVIGVSAGAAHGCSYLSNQHGRSIRYYEKYCDDARFMSFRNLITTGDFVGVQFSYYDLPNKYDLYDYEAFAKNESEFYVVCSNLVTGKPEYIRITDMRSQVEYLRASASLPYFSRIVEIDGNKYLDGGCTDAIPFEAFGKMGFDKNVVVLTRPADYRKTAEKPMFSRLFYKKYPEFVSAMHRRHEMYNSTVERVFEAEARGEIFVIRPQAPLPASRLEHDRQKVRATYDVGREDATRELCRLKAWLETE